MQKTSSGFNFIKHHAGFLCLFSILAGCAQKGVVEGFADWEHHLQGGVIAGPLLPPPGFDRPYPKVGRVPQKSVALPSSAARTALTEKLIAQRNLAHYIAVRDGALTLPPIPPSPSASQKNTHTQTGETASATMTVARQDPAGAPPDQARVETARGEATMQPCMPLPEVTRHAPPPIRQKDIPSISIEPPAAPQIAGFRIPDTPVSIPPPMPPVSLADAPGRLVRFAKASDMLDAQEIRTISRVSGQYQPGHAVLVTGFGDTPSFMPADQIAALHLAILRARRVAEALSRHGVSPTDIRLEAHPMGQGVRIDVK